MRNRITIALLLLMVGFSSELKSQCSVDIIGDLEICLGESTTLTAIIPNNPTNVSYAWSEFSVSESILVTPEVSQDYSVTVTYNDTCIVADTVSVIVYSLPEVSFTAPDDLCLDAGIQAGQGGGSPEGGIYSGPGVTDDGNGESYSFDPQMAGVGEHTITYNYTDPNGCSNSASDVVVVFDLPEVSFTAPDDLCLDAGIQAGQGGGSPEGGIYSGPGVTDDGNGESYSFDPQMAGVGEHTITYNYTDLNGCSKSASDVVKVFDLPEVSFTAPDDLCLDAGIQAGQGGGSPEGGAYSGPGVTDDGNGESYSFDPQMAGVGEHTITYNFTDPNGCSKSASDMVKVFDLPQVSFTAPGDLCLDAAIQVGQGGGSPEGGTYTGPGVTNDGNGMTYSFDPQAAGVGEHTLTYGYTDLNGCSKLATDVVEVFDVPLAMASSGGPYCVGSTIELSGEGGTSYVWSGPNNFNETEQNPSIPDCDLSNGGAYTLAITDNNGCKDTAMIDVVVENQITPQFTFPTEYCLNDIPELLPTTSTEGVSGSWNPESINTMNEGVTDYVFTPDSDSCAIETTISIEVFDLPNIAASNMGPYCEGETIDLKSMGGNSYVWSGPNGFNSTEDDPTISNSMSSNGGTYYLTGSDTNGCSNLDSTFVVINVKSIPMFTIQDTLCAGDEAMSLEENSDNDIDGSWNPSSISTSSPGSTTYTFTPDEDECAELFSITIVILAAPNATATNTGPYCEGDSISLNSSGGITYNWSGPNNYSSTDPNPTIENASSANSGTYSVTVTNSNECQDIVSTTVVVNDNPIANNSNTGPYCEGDSILLLSEGGMDYEWKGPNSFTSDDQNPVIPECSVVNDGFYQVTVMDENGCIDSAKTNVIVHVLPSLIVSNMGPYCVGETIAFEVVAENINSYNWTGPADFNSELESPTIPNAQIMDDGVYELFVIDENNCQNADTTIVEVNENPNVTISGPSEICEGEMAALSAYGSGGNGNYEYDWGASGMGANISISPPNTTNIMVTVTDGNECSGVDDFVLTVNKNPDVKAEFKSSDQNDYLSQGIQFGFNTIINSDSARVIEKLLWTFDPPIDSLALGNNQFDTNISTLEIDSILGLIHSTTSVVKYTLEVIDDKGCSTLNQGQLFFRAKNLCFLELLNEQRRFCEGAEFDLIVDYTPSTTAGISFDTVEWAVINVQGDTIQDAIRNSIIPSNPSDSIFPISCIINEPGIYNLVGKISENMIIGDFCDCFVQPIVTPFEIVPNLKILSYSFDLNTSVGIDTICEDQLPVKFIIEYEPASESAASTIAINGNDINEIFHSTIQGGLIEIEIDENLISSSINMVEVTSLRNTDIDECASFESFSDTIYLENCSCEFRFLEDYFEKLEVLEELNGLLPQEINQCQKEQAIDIIPITDLNLSDTLMFLVTSSNTLDEYYLINDLEDANIEYRIFKNLNFTFEEVKDSIIGLEFGQAFFVYPLILSGNCLRLAISETSFTFYPNPDIVSRFELDEYCLNDPAARLMVDNLDSIHSPFFFDEEMYNYTSVSQLDFELDTIFDGSDQNDRVIGLYEQMTNGFSNNSQEDFEIEAIYSFLNTGKTCSDFDTATVQIGEGKTIKDENAFIKWWPGNILASSFQGDSLNRDAYMYQWGKNESVIDNADSWFIKIEENNFNEFGIPISENENQIDYWVDVWTIGSEDCKLRLYYTGDGFQPRLEKEVDQFLEFTIYPNPTTGQFTLNVFDQLESIQQFDVHDTQGRKVYSLLSNEIQNTNTIDLSALSPGLYLTAMIYKNGMVRTQKLILVN